MAKTKAHILIVDDNEDILLALKLFLSAHFEKITVAKNPNLIPSMIWRENYDVTILDMNFTAGLSSGNEGIYWMNQILEHDPAAVIIFITAYGDIDLAVKAIKEGATDFIQKPWNEEKLLATIHTACQLRRSKLEIRTLKDKQRHLSENINKEFTLITGISQAMREIMGTVKKVADTDANILLLGENGTGKELIAREIHKGSHRSEEVFTSVDMGAITESLFESEMFGHVKGAFTDALEDRPGRFEIASGGTLFLDEIGNLSWSLQSKLLTVIQNREVTRIGSNRSTPVDIRLISATNRNLTKMVERHEFREDLLYRLNTIQIEVPSLRERKEDIRILADHFLKIYSKKYNKELLSFNGEALMTMEAYQWPGNIRELQHTVEKAVILSEKGIITTEDLFQLSRDKIRTEIHTLDLKSNEKALILKSIQLNNGNLAKSARDLGITRKTLYNKLKKYGI